MNQYLVYQLPFEHPNKRDMSFFTPEEIAAISDEYVLVARGFAKNLNEVFEMGNGIAQGHRGGELMSLGEMHSISVGDIIADITNEVEYVVASFGFEKIVMKESV